MTPRLERDWRSVLDRYPVSELVFFTDLPAPVEKKARETGPAISKTRDRRPVEKIEKIAYNKKLAENLVEDDPLGTDPKEGSPNYSQAFALDLARRRRLSRTLGVIMAKVAEDLAGRPIPGDEEWDPDSLMERRLTRRPLSQCRISREKRSLVLILDTSGSCLPQARFYNRLADAAVKAGDVELYAAPNAGLLARRGRRGWKGLADPSWKFKGRTIIFFGDFDGGDAVVEASWRNKVYWFCSEGTRYPSMREHPWCSHTLSQFKGHYFLCRNDDEFLNLWRKVR